MAQLLIRLNAETHNISSPSVVDIVLVFRAYEQSPSSVAHRVGNSGYRKAAESAIGDFVW
jgi:hypothetical protein